MRSSLQATKHRKEEVDATEFGLPEVTATGVGDVPDVGGEILLVHGVTAQVTCRRRHTNHPPAKAKAPHGVPFLSHRTGVWNPKQMRD